jgi:CubicO group peptidase (beta-lactamase class C family)
VGALLALAISMGIGQTASAAPSAKRITKTVRAISEKYPVRSTLFGVWVKGRPLAIGALGKARPGVLARKAAHFRVGNVTESFTTSLLLQFADEGRVSLDDPLSNWFPELPGAQQVTLGMLARSVSGYADFVTYDKFATQQDADPYRRWKVSELIDLAFERPALFAPGASWAFSDTNFLLLGEVLRQVGGKPLSQLLRERILSPLGLDETGMRIRPGIPAPVIHGYTRERGRYEDATRWSPSWVPGIANMFSTLGDLGRWATALGTGKVVSPDSHALQFGPQNVGLGPLTEDGYYGMGSIVHNGWVFNNPQVLAYNGVLAYSASKRTAVVAFTTQGPKGNPLMAYASAVANAIAKRIDPKHPLGLPVCTRPPC